MGVPEPSPALGASPALDPLPPEAPLPAEPAAPPPAPPPEKGADPPGQCCVSMSTLQMGQRLFSVSHWSTQETWKRCMQGRRRTSSPSSSSHRQMVHLSTSASLSLSFSSFAPEEDLISKNHFNSTHSLYILD